MTIYYRGPCVRITQAVFETWCPAYRIFLLRDLRGVHMREQAADPPPLVGAARRASTGAAGAVAVAATLGRVEGWQVYQSPVVAVTLLATLVLAIAVAGACWRIRPVERGLVAIHRGVPVTLYRTTDHGEFGQVRRALIRAMERLDDTRSGG